MGEVSAREEEPMGKAVAGMRSEGTGDRTTGGPWGDPAFTPSSRRRAGQVCSLELARDSGWSLAKRLRETGPEAQKCQGPWHLGSTLEKHTIKHTCPVKTGHGHVCTLAPCPLSVGGVVLCHPLPVAASGTSSRALRGCGISDSWTNQDQVRERQQERTCKCSLIKCLLYVSLASLAGAAAIPASPQTRRLGEPGWTGTG